MNVRRSQRPARPCSSARSQWPGGPAACRGGSPAVSVIQPEQPRAPNDAPRAQGACTSGKCSAQCSRSASRTNARSSALATRNRPSSSRWRSIGAPAIVQRTARRSNSSSSARCHGVLVRRRRSAGGPGQRPRVLAARPRCQRAAQREHVALTVVIVAARGEQLLSRALPGLLSSAPALGHAQPASAARSSWLRTSPVAAWRAPATRPRVRARPACACSRVPARCRSCISRPGSCGSRSRPHMSTV